MTPNVPKESMEIVKDVSPKDGSTTSSLSVSAFFLAMRTSRSHEGKDHRASRRNTNQLAYPGSKMSNPVIMLSSITPNVTKKSTEIVRTVSFDDGSVASSLPASAFFLSTRTSRNHRMKDHRARRSSHRPKKYTCGAGTCER